MKAKIAVHLHLYYLDMWENIKNSYLVNLDSDYFLYVTMNEDNEEIKKDILSFHPNSKIVKIENLGFDIGPFIYFLHDINLDEYEYLLKIHTKGSSRKVYCYYPKNYYIDYKIWFKLLADALLKDKATWHKNLTHFENDKTLGMLSSKYTIYRGEKAMCGNEQNIFNLLQKMNYHYDDSMEFVVGTIFMVRSQLMKVIKDNITFDDFANSLNAQDGTISHAIERILGYVIHVQGYNIKGYDFNLKVLWDTFRLGKVGRFFFDKRITSKNYLLIRILGIPVFHKKLTDNPK